MWIVLYLKFKRHSYSYFMPINMLDNKFKHWQNVNRRIWLRWPISASIVWSFFASNSIRISSYCIVSERKREEKKCLAVSTIESNRINRKEIHVWSHHDEHPHNSRVRLTHIIIYFLLHLLDSTRLVYCKNLGPTFSASKYGKYMMRTANIQNT